MQQPNHLITHDFPGILTILALNPDSLPGLLDHKPFTQHPLRSSNMSYLVGNLYP